jgi:hypothetical protein
VSSSFGGAGGGDGDHPGPKGGDAEQLGEVKATLGGEAERRKTLSNFSMKKFVVYE